MRSRMGSLAILSLCLGGLSGISYGQDSSQQQEEQPKSRQAIGFRVRLMPLRSLSVMANGRSMTTTTANNIVYDWSFNTTSHSPIYGIGPAFEFQLSSRTTLTAEVLFDRLAYTRVSDTIYGSDDPTTGNDERSRITITENTKARLWDVPLIVHHSPFHREGVLSHLFLAGGVTDRIVTTIRTTNNITYADATTASNTNKTQAE